MKSLNKALVAIHQYNADLCQGLVVDSMETILLQFYKDRSIEIICHLDKQELMLDDMNLKIGGTD